MVKSRQQYSSVFKLITSNSVLQIYDEQWPIFTAVCVLAAHSLLMSSSTQGRMWLCTHITFKITTQQPFLSFYSKNVAQFALCLHEWIEATNYLKTHILQVVLNWGILFPVSATLFDYNFVDSAWS